MPLISFVIPCYGSEKTISFVIDEIISVVSQKKEFDYEIIAVNDCSKDNVWNVLLEQAKQNPNIKLINFAKNMNRPGAVMAGMRHSKGDYVVIMDDDGQCPMDRFWDLLAPLNERFDVSMAKYTEYKQSKFKSLGTVVNRTMTEFVIEKPKDLYFTNFMILKKFVVEEIINYKNPYPYLTGLILRTTEKIINVPMQERQRISGTTTFTLSKMINLWVNGFTAFSVKPLRISSLMGVIFAIIGFVFGIVTVIRKIVIPDIAVGWSSTIAVMLFMGGLIMLMLGMIGEYIGRIYISLNNSPQYVIKETVNLETTTKKNNT